ncbi:ribokinase [Deinococcus sonorensis]|uniref:Ribokinase n=2 Tax=Deinococcus sonorensis TaxID=309891 RepID=A0AAU7UG64_9DEIO
MAGSANVDFLTPVPHIPAPGETVLGEGYSTAPGGKGANQAVAAGRIGGAVALLAALGQDAFAPLLRASLQASGVQDLTVTVDAPTGAAFISVAAGGENAITVASGANARLAPGHLPALDGVSWLVLQLEVPLETSLAYARQARARGASVLLNAAPARALPDELLRCIDLLVVNEGELEALAGVSGPVETQLETVRQRGPGTVLVTLGERGSVALDPSGLQHCPAHPVQVQDTTGAGDTYVGVLAAALHDGKALAEAMRRASVAAALACTRPGAQPSMPTRAELDAALA